MSESFASMEDRGVPEISAEEEAVLADRLSPQREAEIRELCRGEARMAPRGWMATAQELLAELAAVRKERDEARKQLDARTEDVAFLERATLPELRREIQHHKAGKQRWRDRAEKAEAELADAVRVSEELNRRLIEEMLAGSALYAALTMPTTPEQLQDALTKFQAVAQKVIGADAAGGAR